MNINTNGLSSATVAITDYKVISANVAKVMISFTGKQSGQEIAAAIGAKLKHLAAPVEASFRIVKDNVAVGFVRATREIRPVEDEKELRAGYRVMSSAATNIMMDNNDQTLWELKTSAGGKYLARHGHEDLSELVEASTSPLAHVPRIASLSLATASPKEFVAFASPSGDMDYGFCTASAKDGSKIKVVSHATGRETVVDTDAVAGVYNVQIQLSAHRKITAAGISREDKNQQIDYYTRLYGYDKEYLNLVIQNIEESAAM